VVVVGDSLLWPPLLFGFIFVCRWLLLVFWILGV